MGNNYYDFKMKNYLDEKQLTDIGQALTKIEKNTREEIIIKINLLLSCTALKETERLVTIKRFLDNLNK